MAILKCKMCGGDLMLNEDSSVAQCEYCGTKQTVPTADNDKKISLFQRANKLRFSCDFDKAAGVYETIVSEFPEEAEAYWGLLLCKYGIEYVDDPSTGNKIPTCHRSSFQSIMDDSDFEMVMENADDEACTVYRTEAKQIEELRKRIIEVSAKEEPYDIFICYKETAPDGDRTIDSVIAQDVYDALTEKGYRVFFSRITLEDKLGQEYEPYIFAALNSAKIMLAFGTDYLYYNAVWVKNEWSRFLQLIAKGEKKTLIPCYKNIDAYDMPKEFAKLQAQDMGKVGAIQDLLRGIEKILPKQTEVQKETIKETVVVQPSANNPTVDSLLKRVFMFIEDEDFKSADEYCEKVLDIDPECGRAYLGKLMVTLKVRSQADLMKCEEPFDELNAYQKALKYADKPLADEISGYVSYIKKRNENDRLDNIYNEAISLFMTASNQESDLDKIKLYTKAYNQFNQIPDHKDAKEKADMCCESIYETNYNSGLRLMEEGNLASYFKASEIFKENSNWKDSKELYKKCLYLVENCKKDNIYNEAKKLCGTYDMSNVEKGLKLYESIRGWRDTEEILANRTWIIYSVEQKANYDKANRSFSIAKDSILDGYFIERSTRAILDAANEFKKLSGFEDADEKAEECICFLREFYTQKREKLIKEFGECKGFSAAKRRKEIESEVKTIDFELSQL